MRMPCTKHLTPVSRKSNAKVVVPVAMDMVHVDLSFVSNADSVFTVTRSVRGLGSAGPAAEAADPAMHAAWPCQHAAMHGCRMSNPPTCEMHFQVSNSLPELRQSTLGTWRLVLGRSCRDVTI